jgi:RND family efflux transporter MFP subunit
MTKKILLPAISFIALGLVIAWMANLFNDRTEPGVSEQTDGYVGEATLVILQDVPIIEAVPGTIIAKQATDISSRILARIEQINVRAGDSVKKGQKLVQLEQTDLQSRKAQASEQVRSVEARLTEATLQLQRFQDLFEKRMVARSELDSAIANEESLQAELSQAKQLLIEMQSALEFSTILAPISGRIIDRYKEPGDTASPGEKILSLYNPLSLRVEANVRERIALGLSLGESLTIEIPSLQRQLSGTIEEIVPAANAGSRSFQIQVMMDYSTGMLPGMFTRLKFELRKEKRLLVPTDNIASVGQIDVVWVQNESRVEKRIITTGKTYNQMTEVLTGLGETDQILPVQH